MSSQVFIRGRKMLHYRDHYYPKAANMAYDHMEEWLRKVERSHDTKTRILLVPNGSYRICGQIMAAAYSMLCPEAIKRIFVFGRTSSFLPYSGALSSMDNLETPLGSLPVDDQVNAELMKTGDFKYFDVPTDTAERFIEMQLPFIAKVMENRQGKFKVVPVYVGTLAHDQLLVMARRFVDYLRDPQNVFIFSVSLCHWGQIYGFNTLKPDAANVLDSIKAVDEAGITAIGELRFLPFDQFLLDSKAAVHDNQIISMCLLVVQQMLDIELCALTKLEYEQAVEAMKTTATFRLMGQTWSFPDVQLEDSCISYFAAVVRFDQEKYITEEPEEPNPLNKCV